MNNPLNDLNDAEDFLDYFQVPYNSRVVNVIRLHILKQFRSYLDDAQLLDRSPNDPEVWKKQRQLLIQAYQAFINTSPSRPDEVPGFQLNKNKLTSSCSSCSTGCK